MESWKKPTKEQINKAISLLARKEQYRYFFDKLENPEWLVPLNEKNMFSTPPDVILKGDYYTHPRWPALLYLNRMTIYKPEIITEIIKKMPLNNNVTVNQDILDIIIKIPPTLSSKLTDIILVIIDSFNIKSLSDSICEQINILSKNGYAQEALKIADSLFRIEKDNDNLKENNIIRPNLRTRIEHFDYENALENTYKNLLYADKKNTLKMLIDKLKMAIKFNNFKNKNDDFDDFSTIWENSIENERQFDIKSILVKYIRLSCEFLIDNSLLSFLDVYSFLNEQNKLIFNRISLFLLNKYRGNNLNEIKTILTSESIFNDYRKRHEYVELLRSSYKLIDKESQNKIKSFVNNGPNLDEYKSNLKENNIVDSDELISKYKENWLLTHLSWFNNEDLDFEYKKIYDELVNKYGKPEHPEFSSYIGNSWTGPTSPKSVEELKQYNLKDLVIYLKECTFSDNIMSPSMEGLSRNLTQLAREKVEEFSSNINEFIGLDSTYIRGILMGLIEAVNNGKLIEWNQIVPFCNWIISQPREIVRKEKRNFMDADPHWGWTRKDILRLFEVGFNKDLIDISLKDEIWKIIEFLSEDPDPTVNDDKGDLLTIAINTTRGEAILTVVSFALWIRRWMTKQIDAVDLIAQGFDYFPQIKILLEKHLDTKKEFSLAVRAAYGERLPQLILLDKKWVIKFLPEIFPDDKPNEYDAVWDSYITWQSPYDDVYDITRNYYLKAVNKLNTEINIEIKKDSNEALAKHIMSFYWRGKLNDEFGVNLFNNFWNIKNPLIRAHALTFVGESLYYTKEEINPTILERLISLWEKRLVNAKLSDNKENIKDELESFGWWFASNKFDESWNIKQLKDSLALYGQIDLDHEVIKILVGLIDKYTKDVLLCLDLMVKGDNEGWNIYRWKEEIKEILMKAINTNEKELAKKIINYLGTRGYSDLEELLN